MRPEWGRIEPLHGPAPHQADGPPEDALEQEQHQHPVSGERGELPLRFLSPTAPTTPHQQGIGKVRL